MNQDLWNSILAFDLDDPPGEYSFSIRLAAENYWTKAFTEQAILEYKKFMYLAATSDKMVSPSGVVDEVWHLHLIFTKSYNDFCEVLGKQIQHVPSTHNREEFQKFKLAKQRTTELYEEIFGPQPADIWAYDDMFESLHLPKAKLKIREFVLIGILVFFILAIPAYRVLLPLYNKINNPWFLTGLSLVSIAALFFLNFYNDRKLREIVSGFDETSFIFNLHPFELICLQTQRFYTVINGAVNEMIVNGSIVVNRNATLQLSEKPLASNAGQKQIISSLAAFGNTTYPDLALVLAGRPVFSNVHNSMDAFRKYFIKSKKFARIFYINFVVLGLILLLGFVRMLTGLSQHKASGWAQMVVFVLVFITIAFLFQLTKQVCTKTIPLIYKKQLLHVRTDQNDWQWQYFLLGPAVLAVAFAPLAKDVFAANANTGSGCGSSCGGGGSCGGGCGGCGS